MTLFYYMIKDFFKYVLGTIFLCLFIFIMFDFIHKTTKYFAIYKPETSHIIQFYLYQIPSQLVQSLPIAALLASVISMVLMSRTNEITAMRAAGMSPIRVGAPIAIGGILVSLFSFGIGEFVAPLTSKKMRYVEQVLIKNKSASQVNEGARWLRRDNTLYHFEDYNPLTQTMYNVRIIETGLNFRPKQTIEARKAFFQTETDDWQLQGIRVLYFNPNGTLAYTETRESQVILFPIEPKKLAKEHRKPNELALIELYDLVQKGEQAGIDVASYKVDMHVKFAFYFAAFVVSLIGLKFGYRSERTVETARGVLLAIGIGMSYWFILNAGQALGKRGTLPPLLSAWAANLVVFAIGAYSIWQTRKA